MERKVSNIQNALPDPIEKRNNSIKEQYNWMLNTHNMPDERDMRFLDMYFARKGFSADFKNDQLMMEDSAVKKDSYDGAEQRRYYRTHTFNPAQYQRSAKATQCYCSVREI